MNNKDYLEKIASDTRTSKPSGKGLFGGKVNLSPNMIKGLIIGAAAVFVVMIIGIILTSGDKNKEIDYVDKINLRTNNMITAISDYTKKIKSSELRSMGNSLKAVLTETNYAVGASLKEEFGVKNTSKPNKEKTQTDEDAIAAEMTETLENGRLNGILDRVFTREMTYQIALLMSLEQETYGKTNKENLRISLESSINNLQMLHEQFDNYAAE